MDDATTRSRDMERVVDAPGLGAASSYGASEHYLGNQGKEYFAWQGGGGPFAGKIDTHKFEGYIRTTDVALDFGCGGGFLLKNLACARRIEIKINIYSHFY